jgi:hypothetical protein
MLYMQESARKGSARKDYGKRSDEEPITRKWQEYILQNDNKKMRTESKTIRLAVQGLVE